MQTASFTDVETYWNTDNLRITSYNVCYTKLLRDYFKRDGGFFQSDFRHDEEKQRTLEIILSDFVTKGCF